MIHFVTGEQAHRATADQIERGLFKLLISLGAKLLTLFFVIRSQACSRETLPTAAGQAFYYHGESKRDYFSLFGKLAFWRPYFYKTGLGGQSPLDTEWSLGEDCYSDLVREVSEYLGVYDVYHKTTDILERLLGLSLSTRVVEENMPEDAAAVEAYYAQKPLPAPADEAELLVIQADGKGVPMILETPAEPKVRLGKGEKRGRKKEAIVTTVYTIAAAPRTPEKLVAGLFHPQRPAAEARPAATALPKPQHKHLWATLEGKEAALTRLAKQVEARQGPHIQQKIALTDGDPALQTQVETHFPDFTLFIHPTEYLWNVANSLLGETSDQRRAWVEAQTRRMLSSQTDQIIADFRTWAEQPDRTPAQQEKLIKTAHYFERNLPYIDYHTYLTTGWPVASGVIEGVCRHFVKDRCELSGMRWSQAGAENLLRLRAVAAWRERMGTDAAKALYKQRAASVECVNAQTRTQRGVYPVRVRGQAKVKCLALWTAITHNLLIWLRHLRQTLTPPRWWRPSPPEPVTSTIPGLTTPFISWWVSLIKASWDDPLTSWTGQSSGSSLIKSRPSLLLRACMVLKNCPWGDTRTITD